jgi:hypothetical protein
MLSPLDAVTYLSFTALPGVVAPAASASRSDPALTLREE